MWSGWFYSNWTRTHWFCPRWVRTEVDRAKKGGRVLSKVVTITSEYNCTAVYPKNDLTELGTNMKGVIVLLGVDTNALVRPEVSMNRTKSEVEIGLWCLVRGGTSHANSSYTNLNQTASTWIGHKFLALSGLCRKHCQKEFKKFNRALHGLNRKLVRL